MALEVPVQDWVAPWLWTCSGYQAAMAGKCMWKQSVGIMKQEADGQDGPGPHNPFPGHAPNDLGPTSYRSTTSQWGHPGDQTHGAEEDMLCTQPVAGVRLGTGVAWAIPAPQ